MEPRPPALAELASSDQPNQPASWASWFCQLISWEYQRAPQHQAVTRDSRKHGQGPDPVSQQEPAEFDSMQPELITTSQFSFDTELRAECLSSQGSAATPTGVLSDATSSGSAPSSTLSEASDDLVENDVICYSSASSMGSSSELVIGDREVAQGHGLQKRRPSSRQGRRQNQMLRGTKPTLAVQAVQGKPSRQLPPALVGRLVASLAAGLEQAATRCNWQVQQARQQAAELEGVRAAAREAANQQQLQAAALREAGLQAQVAAMQQQLQAAAVQAAERQLELEAAVGREGQLRLELEAAAEREAALEAEMQETSSYWRLLASHEEQEHRIQRLEHQLSLYKTAQVGKPAAARPSGLGKPPRCPTSS